MKAALRPGGVIYFHVHLYTSNTGHHDIRAFTGGTDDLPPWAHLRPSTQGQVTPSAWLNQWRLRDWRAMLDKHAPGPYLRMLRQNGIGRFLKTVGRKMLGVDRRHARAWQRELGVKQLSLVNSSLRLAANAQKSETDGVDAKRCDCMRSFLHFLRWEQSPGR